MAIWLKKGISAEDDAADIAKVRSVVEEILADIEKTGDKAVRKLSKKFDKWDPKDFKLSKSQIEDCVKSLPKQVIDDIKFAQSQIRNFAQSVRILVSGLRAKAETVCGQSLRDQRQHHCQRWSKRPSFLV